MTKEELAKKKGLKTQKNTQTAAEALITTKKESKEEVKFEEPKIVEEVKVDKPKNIEKVKVEKPKTVEDVNKSFSSQISNNSIQEEQSSVTEKSKVGRPKGKPSTRVSINLPLDALEYARFEAGMNYSANLSGYILHLIENDRKINGAIYEQIKKK